MRTDIAFEKVIQIIHESFKDKPDTKIHHQYKIESLDGRKREIDVFIELKINNIIFKVAIECKDYKSKISVGKIEEFYAKCLSIPEINRKLFVSRLGYQKGAIEAAKRFGIELYLLEKLDEQSFKNWLPQISPVNFEVVLNRSEIEFYEEEKPEYLFSDIVNFEGENEKFILEELFRMMINTFLSSQILIFDGKKEKENFEVNANFENTNAWLEKNDLQFFKFKKISLIAEIRWNTDVEEIYFDRYKSNEEGGKTEISTAIGKDGSLFSMIKKEKKESIELFKGNKEGDLSKYAEVKITKIDEENEI